MVPTPVFLSFPCGSAVKKSACTEGNLGLIPGLGRSPGEGKGYPLQYSGLENSMDYYIVHGVTKSRTYLSDFHLTAFFIFQLSYLYMTIGKTIDLTIWTFVHKVMFLLLNTVSRFVKVFLPRSLLIS